LLKKDNFARSLMAQGGATMKLKSTLFLLIFSLAFLLPGCNLTQIFPRADVNLALVNGDSLVGASEIVVLVGQTTTGDLAFTIPQLRVAGRALPGSIGAYFGSYAIDYFDSDDNPIQTAPDKSYRGVVKLDIRPGIACPPPTTIDECSVNTPGSYPALGELATSTAFSPLDGDVLEDLLASPGSYGYADIVLDGKDANGNAYSKLIPHVKITFRAGS
jgi:hypothetical protein